MADAASATPQAAAPARPAVPLAELRHAVPPVGGGSTFTFWQLAPLFVGLVLTVSPHVPRLAWWVICWVALLFGWYAVIVWRGQRLPGKWALMLLGLVGFGGVWFTFRTIFGRDAGVTLLVLLLSLKLLELRNLRDVYVCVFLGYFLALTNFFYSQGIPVAALMLLTVVVISAALVGINAPARRLRDNLRTAGLLLAQAAPVMLLLFLLFPRVQGPLWGLPQDAFAGVTGLSDSMSPGAISQLSQSDSIAFRVKFETSPPPHSQRYWRGPVFWEYDGRTWRGGDMRLRAGFTFEGLGTPLNYEVTLEPHNRNWLFGLDLPAVVPPNSRATPDYQLLSLPPVRSRLRYQLTSYTSYRATTMEDEDRTRALALPRQVNPRARALAAEWRAKHANDEELLREAIIFFRTGQYLYTLEPPLLGRDAVDEFLFDTKQGFCEHFSSAFVFMMRAAGIPARVVTGYQGGELNPVDGFLTVRQADAHAWAEVWLGERGWVRVDPTAASVPLRVESGLQAAVPQNANLPLLMRPGWSWLRNARDNWEALGNKWNQWVLGYNPDRQRDLLSFLGVEQPSWQTLAIAMFWSVGAVVLGIAVWLFARRQRVDRVQRAWLRFGAKLARAGFPRGPSEGPLDYARRLSASRPAQAATVEAIAAMYVELRYGSGADDARVAEFGRMVGRFRA